MVFCRTEKYHFALWLWARLLDKWLTRTPHSNIEPENKKELVTDSGNVYPWSLNKISDLKSQLQILQTNYAIAEEIHSRATAAAQLHIQDLQQEKELLQTKIFAAEQRIRQTAEIHKEQIDNYRNKHELLQAQYNTAID